jgi:macrodomain Ter protein organizer (MatP/YcbG family)
MKTVVWQRSFWIERQKHPKKLIDSPFAVWPRSNESGRISCTENKRPQTSIKRELAQICSEGRDVAE